jgi:microsomal dipeptidase-like Zn-dependent dipeptidase
MHCHYPMHLAAEEPKRKLPGSPNLTVDAMTKFSRRPGWVEKLRAGGLRVAANFLNFRDDHWRVSLSELERGDVRCVFSVLYEPFAEFDLDELPGADPEPTYFGGLLERLDGVEADLAEIDLGKKRHEIVSTEADLDRVTKEGKVAFMHCVEGGFHLGAGVEEIKANVAELKERGVVYVTLAHLFWRGIATNAPAIPFLEDRCYKTIFHQPRVGLSDLGRAAVEAMYENRILIDVSHMSERALDATFALLEELDEKAGADATEHPVIATHAGYRFGKQEYMLSPRTIRRIAGRGGVIGLILARHQLNENAEVANPDDPEETHAVLRRHIDAIRLQVPGHTNAHVAIGSDLDGFIKPTVAGVETAGDLGTLVGPLRDVYGDDAEMILSGNAMNVVRKALKP